MTEFTLESWSRDYVLVNGIDVERQSGDLALMDEVLYRKLAQRVHPPLIGYIGGYHYDLKPSRALPTGRVAVPKANHRSETGKIPLLLVK